MIEIDFIGKHHGLAAGIAHLLGNVVMTETPTGRPKFSNSNVCYKPSEGMSLLAFSRFGIERL